jgi:hypothetical protein
VKKGLPAVVVVSEQFEKLAKVVLASQDIADATAVVIKGNPESFSDDVLKKMADRLLEEVVECLTKDREE